MAELSPEQQIVHALVAREHGPEVADRVVDEDRIAAYLIGAHLAPPLERLAACVADLLATFRALPSSTGDANGSIAEVSE